MALIHNSHLYRRLVAIASILVQLLLAACGTSQADQTKASSFKIGMISTGAQFVPIIAGFKAGMADLGYVDGKNVTYIYDGPTTSRDQLDPAAQKLLAAKIDLITTFGTSAAQAAQKATVGTTIPVVFVPVVDPVAEGIVQSLKNPGGNLTGVATGVQVHAQRLEWLLKISPNVKRVYIPYDPSDPATVPVMKAIQDAASKLGVELVTQQVHTADDVTAALGTIPGDVDAIFIVPGNIVGPRVKDFIQASLQRKLPLSSNLKSQIDLGSLLTYSFGDAEVGKQLAGMADRILKGTKPADLPVQSAEFFLAVNVKTAQAINLTIPDEVLRQATTIVR